MKLRLLQYNILNGFCQDFPPYSTVKKRMKAASKILNKQKADIISLNEAFFWPFALNEKIKNYEKFFSELYKIKAPTNRMFRWAPVIISKFPITWKDHTIRELKFIEAEVTLSETKKISLFVMHPSHEDYEDKKEFLIHKILSEKTPEILMGDMNSFSPEDNYDKDKLIAGFKTFMHNQAEYKINDSLKAKTIKSILDKGLTDTFVVKNKTFDYTMPTDMRSKNKDSAIRIDYIFCNKNFKVLDAGIIKNKETEIASDHYPVYATLDIN